MSIRRITIIGVGLVGGSLGKAWKTTDAADVLITGVDHPLVLERAVASGAIDVASDDTATAVADADLVVLATPLSAIMSTLSEIAADLKPRTIVTDVGSVKVPIVRHALETIGSETLFVGGHPMAGSEVGGIDHASRFLFENATWVLCPPDTTTDDQRYDDLVALIQATGARAIEMTPREHDEVAASVSHVPQLLAVALTNTVGRQNESNPNYLKLAAGGFRDLTRVAGSDAGIWRDILAANHGSILDALALFSAELQRVRNRLLEEDFGELHASFDRARKTRETIPKDSKGFISPLADVYVHADDRPGWIASVATLLADADINILDMELLKVREGTGGTFRMSFADHGTAKSVVNLLKTAGLTAYTLD